MQKSIEMAELDASIHDPDQQEEKWEERTLNLLDDSKIDQELTQSKKRRGGRKHKQKWMKRPMALPAVILEFLDEDLRENAIRYLSNYLIEKREEDPENYYRAGFLCFYSCSTMSILLQEVVGFYRMMDDQTFNTRSIKRLANVITLFQSIAANNETRQNFVDSRVPNFLIPLIRFKSTIKVFDTIRAVALSVIGILCQGRESKIIQWAIESDMVDVCHIVLEIGSELSKVIAMHILEAILQDTDGISYICSSVSDDLLTGLMETWDKLVKLLAADQDFSPRLLFHIVRCYIVLCTHDRGYNIVTRSLPIAITNNSFHDMKEEFPIMRNLIDQLLLNVGKITEEPMRSKQVHVPPTEKKTARLARCSSDLVPTVLTNRMPLRAIDLNVVNLEPSSSPIVSFRKGKYPVDVTLGSISCLYSDVDNS